MFFKIKIKLNLVAGNSFSKNANIYFDYNFSITTNTATMTIAALKNKILNSIVILDCIQIL
ncbi:hypothetical protein BWK62_12110 [Flavobacterium oreochromis]|uniref:DUF7619 domain-containing protein n=1 Tax=Flavobacterium columnare TaxID=996 RepID=A0A246G8R5_9FLAO|nr:hypothetical protein BWK62_12110 [Flavobacterium oreochromis]POR20595.1 hypothetical protein BWK58_13870 [Flavobacterium columnare]